MNQDRPQIQTTVTLMKKMHTLLGFFTEIPKSRHSRAETLHTTVHNIVKFRCHKQERAVTEEAVLPYVRFLYPVALRGQGSCLVGLLFFFHLYKIIAL